MGMFGGEILGQLISPTKYPKVPTAANVDPQQAQQSSISGNISALPGLEQLASGVDAFNLKQRRSELDTSIPGFENLLAQGSANMSDWLHGVISPDVAGATIRGSNAQAIAGGYGGSPAARNLQARDLGLTSLNLQQGAEAALPGYMGSMSNLLMGHPFDVTSGMISPGQQISAEQWNETNRVNQQWLQNQMDALPDPLAQAFSNTFQSFDNTMTGIVSKVSTAATTAIAG